MEVKVKPSNEKLFSDALSHVELKLDIKIGEVKSDVASILSLGAGDIFKSSVNLSEKVELNLNGNKVAEGLLIEEDGKFAFQVVNIL